MKTLPLAAVRTDGGTQPRAELSEELIEEYAAALVEGAAFPPVVVFHSGEDHWLADGFHRLEAHRRAGCLDIAADVRKGTLREAVLFSAGANADHGLRRTNEDKRRAVEKLLGDEEWAAWSDREIARRSATSAPLVGRIRGELSVTIYRCDDPQPSGEVPQIERRAERNGTVYTINTERIGAAPAPAPEVPSEQDCLAAVIETVAAKGQERVPELLREQAGLRLVSGGPAAVSEDRSREIGVLREQQERQVQESLLKGAPESKAQTIYRNILELSRLSFSGREFRKEIPQAGYERVVEAMPSVRKLLDEIEEVENDEVGSA